MRSSPSHAARHPGNLEEVKSRDGTRVGPGDSPNLPIVRRRSTRTGSQSLASSGVYPGNRTPTAVVRFLRDPNSGALRCSFNDPNAQETDAASAGSQSRRIPSKFNKDGELGAAAASPTRGPEGHRPAAQPHRWRALTLTASLAAAAPPTPPSDRYHPLWSQGSLHLRRSGREPCRCRCHGAVFSVRCLGAAALGSAASGCGSGQLTGSRWRRWT